VKDIRIHITCESAISGVPEYCMQNTGECVKAHADDILVIWSPGNRKLARRQGSVKIFQIEVYSKMHFSVFGYVPRLDWLWIVCNRSESICKHSCPMFRRDCSFLSFQPTESLTLRRMFSVDRLLTAELKSNIVITTSHNTVIIIFTAVRVWNLTAVTCHVKVSHALTRQKCYKTVSNVDNIT
jgi:hypothetical protein